MKNSEQRLWEKPVVERLGGVSELTHAKLEGTWDSAQEAHGDNLCPQGQYPCASV